MLRLYIEDEITIPDLEGIVARRLTLPESCFTPVPSPRSFDAFSCETIVPIVKVGDLHVAELFHGPTLAFKDFGQQVPETSYLITPKPTHSCLQVLCKLIDHFATQRGTKVTCVVATTGDTGPAAIGGPTLTTPPTTEPQRGP